MNNLRNPKFIQQPKSKIILKFTHEKFNLKKTRTTPFHAEPRALFNMFSFLLSNTWVDFKKVIQTLVTQTWFMPKEGNISISSSHVLLRGSTFIPMVEPFFFLLNPKNFPCAKTRLWWIFPLSKSHTYITRWCEREGWFHSHCDYRRFTGFANISSNLRTSLWRANVNLSVFLFCDFN